jgi:hypothetical protein
MKNIEKNNIIIDNYKIMSYLRVNQGKYCIVDAKNILTTSGLASCTALGMTFGNFKFLCHIDAKTDIAPIIEEIKKYITKPDDIQNVNIWSGSGFICGIDANSSLTTKMAYYILEALDVRNIKMEDKDLIDFDEIVKCAICNSISGTLKILTHTYECKYKERVVRWITDYMDDVEI